MGVRIYLLCISLRKRLYLFYIVISSLNSLLLLVGNTTLDTFTDLASRSSMRTPDWKETAFAGMWPKTTLISRHEVGHLSKSPLY